MKLNTKALAFASGSLWGLGLFILTLLNLYIGGYAGEFLLSIVSVYPGYSLSFAGAFVGAIYGFIDGFIGAFVFAWLYNRFVK